MRLVEEKRTVKLSTLTVGECFRRTDREVLVEVYMKIFTEGEFKGLRLSDGTIVSLEDDEDVVLVDAVLTWKVK